MKLNIPTFLDLFLRSSFYKPATVILSVEELNFAGRMLGFQFEGPPQQMIAGPPDANGEAPWIPVDSPITERMVAGFEKFVGASLPPVFKEYLRFKSLLGMDLYEGILPDIDPRYPLEWLEWCVLRQERPPYRTKPWLIPLTYGPAGLSELCLDTSRPDRSGDYPLIIIHHNEFDQATPDSEHWTVEDIRQRQVFDSFEAYFQFLCHWLIFKSEPRGDDFFPDGLSRTGKPRPPEIYYS
ncbi:SMI1/KNR4 family protein [Singulisphaera rosea]